MKSRLKKFSGIFLVMLILSQSLFVFADTGAGLSKEGNAKNDENLVEPMQLYEYAWVIDSKDPAGISFGAWRIGPTGHGPATLSINDSTTINRTFTNTITGNYTIGTAKISQSLGISIGKAETHGTAYSITIGAGETKTIIYRPKIQKYKIVSTYYRYPVGTVGNRVAIKTETAYVDSFSSWEYDWRYGY